MTDGPTEGPTDQRTNGRTHPLIEMLSASKNGLIHSLVYSIIFLLMEDNSNRYLKSVKKSIIQAKARVIEYGVSDHFAVFCSRGVPKGSLLGSIIKKVRSMKSYNPTSFRTELARINWRDIGQLPPERKIRGDTGG